MTAFITNLNYPPELRRQRIGGLVLVQVSVDSTGRVVDAHIVKSADPILDRIVVDAVRRTKWTPALKNRASVPLTFRIPINFTPP